MEQLTPLNAIKYTILIVILNPIFQAHCQKNSDCTLLKTADYQTPFCQNQYQQVLKFTPNVFNTQNQNVVRGQTLGGIIGIYRRIHNQDQICYVSCGLRRLNGSPPDEYTMFELASVTKTFVGSVLGTLVYNKTVRPTDAVAPYLPRNFVLTPNQSTVTFQQLATYSGGVCFSNAPSVRIGSGNPKLNQAHFVMDINHLDPTQNRCPNGKPNVTSVYGTPLPTHNRYSNSSMGLLAQALMNYDSFPNALKGSFNGWICNNVTNPLAMNSTNACMPREAKQGICPANTAPRGTSCNTSSWSSAEYATGYHIKNGQYQKGRPFPFIPWAGGGSLRSNASDMIKFIRANLGVSINNNPKQLALIQGMQIAHNPASFLPAPPGNALQPIIGSQPPLRGRQGYAWVCQRFNKNRICGKIGGHGNFRSFVGISQNKQYGVIILFNTGMLSNKKSPVQVARPSEIGVNLIKNAP